MSHLTNLARQLGGVELSASPPIASAHTLSFEYPVTDLVNEGESMQLEEPTLVAQREAPPFNPATVGIFDTSFFLVLPVQPQDAFAFFAGYEKAVGALYAVEAVATTPGRTTIEAAVCEDDQTSRTFTRLQLRAKYDVMEEQLNLFELDEHEWEQLVEHEREVPWVRMLIDLMRRRSARACYHVRNRLYAAFGEAHMPDEEAAWSTSWGSCRPRNVRQLLHARLFPKAPRTPYVSMDSWVKAKTPCGHKYWVRRITMLAMPDEGCYHYKCQECLERVLQLNDLRELIMREQLERVNGYALSTVEEWESLDSRIVQDDEEVRITPTGLMCALAAALGSLRAPMLVCPPELSFPSLNQTKFVFRELEKQFAEPDLPETSTASRILNGLLNFAAEAPHGEGATTFVQQALPPGWTNELHRWLTRTVRLLADRGCSRKGEQHLGLHKHGDQHKAVMNPVRI